MKVNWMCSMFYTSAVICPGVWSGSVFSTAVNGAALSPSPGAAYISDADPYAPCSHNTSYQNKQQLWGQTKPTSCMKLISCFVVLQRHQLNYCCCCQNISESNLVKTSFGLRIINVPFIEMHWLHFSCPFPPFSFFCSKCDLLIPVF